MRKIPWRREWLSTPVILPGESHGQKSLEDYSPWGHKELDMTDWLTRSLHFHSAIKHNYNQVHYMLSKKKSWEGRQDSFSFNVTLRGKKRTKKSILLIIFPPVSLQSALLNRTFCDDTKFYTCIVQYGNTSHRWLCSIWNVIHATTEKLNLILILINWKSHMYHMATNTALSTALDYLFSLILF